MVLYLFIIQKYNQPQYPGSFAAYCAARTAYCGYCGLRTCGTTLCYRLFRPEVMSDKRQVVLFACVHNASRSQMSVAWFNALCSSPSVSGASAGTEPADRVHQVVLEAMQEVGIDLASAKPQKLTRELASSASLLVTMGCGEACPYVPGLEQEDWPTPDPKGQTIEEVRAIRDSLKQKVADLIQRRHWSKPTEA